MDWWKVFESRLCKEVSLKQVYPLTCEPRILLFGLNSLGNNVDSKIETHPVDCLNNGLAWTMTLYALDQVHVQLYLVRLEVGKQVETGISGAKIIDCHL